MFCDVGSSSRKTSSLRRSSDWSNSARPSFQSTTGTGQAYTETTYHRRKPSHQVQTSTLKKFTLCRPAPYIQLFLNWWRSKQQFTYWKQCREVLPPLRTPSQPEFATGCNRSVLLVVRNFTIKSRCFATSSAQPVANIGCVGVRSDYRAQSSRELQWRPTAQYIHWNYT